MQTKFVYGGIFLMILINLSLVTCQSNAENEAAYYKILPMCSKENIYDIKDLYNPIQIGLQILKRGFCLFRPDKIPDEIVEKDKKAEEILINKTITLTKEEINEETKVNLPIVLPDGFCFYSSGKIRRLKKTKNEHIKCKAKDIAERNNIINLIIEKLNDEFQFYTCELGYAKNQILQLIITIYSEYNGDQKDMPQNEKCTKLNQNNQNELLLSLDIIFRKSEEEPFVNIPGLKYGEPLIKLSDKDSLKVLKNYIQVIPYKEDSNLNSNYYNPFVDNSLTFQDTIITSFPKPLQQEDISAAKYSKIMNPSVKDLENWKNEKPEEFTSLCSNNDVITNTVVFNFWYTELGAVNNTQKVLLKMDPCKHGSLPANYLFINFLKKENSKVNWNAPGPRVSIGAKNIMYPFKIGSSNYKSSTSK